MAKRFVIYRPETDEFFVDEKKRGPGEIHTAWCPTPGKARAYPSFNPAKGVALELAKRLQTDMDVKELLENETQYAVRQVIRISTAQE